jgi:integrase
MKKRLTDKFLLSIQPGSEMVPADGRARIWDTQTRDFLIRVTPKAVVSFYGCRRIRGEKQPSEIFIGRYPDMTLAEARDRVDDLTRDMKRGIDPREVEAEQRKAKVEKAKAEEVRTANTFANVAETFIKKYVATKRTAGPIAQLVRREFIARWGDRPVTDISRADIIAMLEEIAEHSPSAAAQAKIYASLLFDWALERGTYGITASPCASIKVSRLIPDLPGPRDRVLTDAEMSLLWQAAWPAGGAEEVYPTGQFVRLLLVLGCRRSELAEMTWDEVDLEKGAWLLKGDRTKNGDSRLIPLPRLAVEMLAAMPRFSGPFTFSTTYGKRPISGFGKIKAALDRRIAKLNGDQPMAPWRLHDLRRSARTNWSAISSISPLVAELLLGHRQRGIAAVYDRHSYQLEQKAALEAWSQRLISIVSPAHDADNVVVLGRR